MEFGRRDMLKVGAALAPAVLAVGAAEAATPPPRPSPATPQPSKGEGIAPRDQSNPLNAKIVTFTVVSPNMAESKRFYQDTMGFTLAEEGTLAETSSTAPGAGKAGRPYALYWIPLATRGAAVRVLEAPPGAPAIRPRPGATTWDPGLLCMEGGTKDPIESYARLTGAGFKAISTPRWYPYRGIGKDVDPMSYAPFGPGGEQLFITASLANDRPEWKNPGLHTTPANAAIVSLDQRPLDAFYEAAFGLKRTNQFVSQQRNCNDLIGAPADACFLWGNIGNDVSIEVWEFKMPSGTVYPTALDKTGLAMLTMRVNDLEKCRAMCKAAGIKIIGEGALPLGGNKQPHGFTIRGAVGELVEVVSI